MTFLHINMNKKILSLNFAFSCIVISTAVLLYNNNPKWMSMSRRLPYIFRASAIYNLFSSYQCLLNFEMLCILQRYFNKTLKNLRILFNEKRS